MSTVRKQLRYLQVLLVFAFRERWIIENVGRDIRAVGHAPRGRRRAFTRAEVGAIFALPIFVRPWSLRTNRQIGNDTLRWLLLIALTTGARLEEIGQLQPDDIRADDGIVHMVIDDVDASGVKNPNKSIKNIGARRLQTVMERVLDEISFEATDKAGSTVTIDADYVARHVGDLAKNTDLSRFIL